jgi:predicted component of type VI protein secretion system
MKNNIHLIIESGPLKGQKLVVPEDGCRLGRDPKTDVPIPDDTLSRVHSRFFFRAGQLWVEDLQSSNGTEVNGLSATSSLLKRGDRVVLGSTRIRVNHASLMATEGLRFRLGRRPAADGPTPTSSRFPWKLVSDVAWLAVMLWWAFLAFSLCLPPPGPPPVSPAPAETPPPAPAPTPVRETAPTPAYTPPPPRASAEVPAEDALQEVLHFVAQCLANEDFDQAASILKAHRNAEHAEGEMNLIDRLDRYVTDVRALHAGIADSLRAQAGRRITLHPRGRPVEVRILAVSGTRLSGMLISSNGEQKVSVDVNKMQPLDRLQWLATPRSPEEHAMRFILNWRGGILDDARAHATESGLLAKPFLQLVDAPSASGS